MDSLFPIPDRPCQPAFHKRRLRQPLPVGEIAAVVAIQQVAAAEMVAAVFRLVASLRNSMKSMLPLLLLLLLLLVIYAPM